MVRKAIIAVLVGGSVTIAACNTVRGAGEDLQSAANCAEDAMKRGQC